MATANASAVEAALLGLSSNDQGALLEVHVYFTNSDCEVEELDDSSSDTEDDDSFDALLEGTLLSNTSILIKI